MYSIKISLKNSGEQKFVNEFSFVSAPNAFYKSPETMRWNTTTTMTGTVRGGWVREDREMGDLLLSGLLFTAVKWRVWCSQPPMELSIDWFTLKTIVALLGSVLRTTTHAARQICRTKPYLAE